MAVGSVRRGTLSTSEDSFPTALPMWLALVEGPDRLPADEGSQEVLRGKLRILEAESEEVNTLFTELSAWLVSINDEENMITVTFKTFDEILKFTTYYTLGFLGQCMENLLLDQEFWLSCLDHEDRGIEVSIQEDTLQLMYQGFLMQEGSFFASCSSNQMFDSSTSGSDLYLEQGDIACFEPPFLGSGWTVFSLGDGARGTKPKPALEPVVPFYQWFLQSCAENILVGSGKPVFVFPFQFAKGTCEATTSYDAEGPDELSLEPGDRIIIVGRLVSCFDWFTGKLEETGEVGLVKTSLVKPADTICEAGDIFLEQEERLFFSEKEKQIIEDTIALLKKTSQNDIGSIYKLGKIKMNEQNNNNNNNNPYIYMLAPEHLAGNFRGQADEEELVAYLAVARETARKRRLHWAQSRLCFLLGRWSVGRSKFSQARVYFEEALSIPRDGFKDMLLLASLYANLATVYLRQKNTEKYFALSDRIAALLMGVPACVTCVEEDSEVLKYILKKAVLAHNKMAEARACFLLAKQHQRQGEGASAARFIERLLVLSAETPGARSAVPSHGYLSLGKIYSQLGLPHLSVSAARRASLHPSARLGDCLGGVALVLENAGRLYGIPKAAVAIPAQVAPYLHRALCFIAGETGGEEEDGGDLYALSQSLTVSLSQLFQKHGMLAGAVSAMQAFVERGPPRAPGGSAVTAPERHGALVWLAWLHVAGGRPGAALDVLEAVLASMPEHCTTPQEGLVLNMRGVALRCAGELRRAAESYQAAIDVCQEFEDDANWAVALANLGLLCLKAGAKGLAQRHLTQAVGLFSGLRGEGHEGNFITVLLELGRHHVGMGSVETGKVYYEWALLMAILSKNSDSQLSATQQLCRLYGTVCSNQAQCIIYNEHQMALLSRRGDRGLEGDVLETVSQLYLGLATERAHRVALDYTKRSLGIFIDLGRKEKEAYAWLQAGKIYHLLGQTELVELYVQVAQDVGLSTGDTHFILKLLENAGDIFFDGKEDRDKAVCFYRDRALPIAVKTGNVEARLRLCNKLVELLLSLKLYGEAVEYAQTALDISITLSNRLNERVAYHRLAALYHCLEQYELAEHYYLKTLSLCPSPLQFDEETLYYVRVYQTLGDIIFYDLKDPFDAAGYYHLALAAAMDLGNKKSQLQLCTRLATIYHNFLVDRELSLYFYQRARAFAAELNVRRINLAPDPQARSALPYKVDVRQ
ncbi:SH3 domain and tetratricopeptide repeat-containing protein 1 [Aplochiton taeniatus]